MNTNYKIELTSDEALVLFEFLSRFSDEDRLEIEDQAEERALWNLHCDLQKTLTELYDSNYKKLLEAARDRLRDELE